MLSSNLLKSKIPISGEGGGGVGGNQFPTFDVESKFAKTKCLGMVLDFEYTKYTRTTITIVIILYCIIFGNAKSNDLYSL